MYHTCTVLYQWLQYSSYWLASSQSEHFRTVWAVGEIRILIKISISCHRNMIQAVSYSNDERILNVLSLLSNFDNLSSVSMIHKDSLRLIIIFL